MCDVRLIRDSLVTCDACRAVPRRSYGQEQDIASYLPVGNEVGKKLAL